ncbi:choice-of-anchor F family protein [uncultured Cocleimonas sp.]|uniref:choice-of-anchor F family protein n=1 Tax=uncultured Cocleimonas sp. TaxID=1051587 RepID=UPI00261B9667|nr:choice-of-anchor F family protein [uncultured Cocleimonas sp.]
MSLQTFRKTPIALAITTAVTMLIATNLQAGQIVTDAPEGEALKTAVSEANKQFGFGGWNFDNVVVNMVNTLDLSPSGGVFDMTTGTYSPMTLGESFESVLTTGGEVRGLLHGKDYPVGEPAGIKVINGDNETKNGKPENCIMTSSYLETGYLGAGNKPVLCSSHFQSHKRFKINLQPTTVAGVASGLGLPVDISFNLVAGDTSTTRYQVLQKINNYTGKRLNGYQIEVLDANGLPNPALTLSEGIGENPGSEGEPNGDIWDVEQMANFSHGLWGPVDHHFADDGFFDNTRVFYTPSVSGNTISYTGPMQGGNYQALFGNWLTAEWAPTGVFHDDDMNPETDAALRAFWGDPEGTGTNAWHKGNSDGWAIATEEDLLVWTGEWYGEGEVEDVLNLGLNYIVNVGDNTVIGDKFTIRITPSVDADQTAPAYVSDPAPAPGYDESEGIVVVDMQLVPEAEDTTEAEDAAAEEAIESDLPVPAARIAPTVQTLESTAVINVGVADKDLNVDATVRETVEVMVTSDHGETEMLVLTESDVNTSRFIGTLQAHASNDDMLDNDGKLNLNKHTNLKAIYVDNKYGAQTTPETLESELTLEVAELPAETETSSGGGSFNTFLMMLLGTLGIRGLFARRKLRSDDTK